MKYKAKITYMVSGEAENDKDAISAASQSIPKHFCYRSSNMSSGDYYSIFEPEIKLEKD